MLMSPRSTLMSSGSPSIRVYWRNGPIRVGSCTRWRSEPNTVVRNLSFWKRRPLAMLISRSKTGPGLSHLIARATTIMRGRVIAKNMQAIAISPSRAIRSGAPSRQGVIGLSHNANFPEVNLRV